MKQSKGQELGILIDALINIEKEHKHKPHSERPKKIQSEMIKYGKQIENELIKVHVFICSAGHFDR